MVAIKVMFADSSNDGSYNNDQDNDNNKDSKSNRNAQ